MSRGGCERVEGNVSGLGRGSETKRTSCGREQVVGENKLWEDGFVICRLHVHADGHKFVRDRM